MTLLTAVGATYSDGDALRLTILSIDARGLECHLSNTLTGGCCTVRWDEDELAQTLVQQGWHAVAQQEA